MNNKFNLDPSLEEDRQDWLEAIEDIYRLYGADGVNAIIGTLQQWRASEYLPGSDSTSVNTPYLNSIPVARQPAYPGDVFVEQRLENILRWNAMAMVLRGQDAGTGIGGHIAT